MAAQLLRVVITRSASLNSVRCPALARRCFLEWSESANGKCTRTLLDARSLHTKTLDKDADWNTQRLGNQHRMEEPVVALRSAVLTEHKPTTANAVKSDDAKTFRTVRIEEGDNLETSGDADVFGGTQINEKEDEGDLMEEEYTSNPPKTSQRLQQIQYIRLIKQQLIAKELKGAIEIVEKRMKEDRVKPETYTYNLLISGCAKAGYTRKAFTLFNKMRQRGLRVTGGTYTSLFNACANAPSEADGLSRANHVREIMLEKGVEPNLKNYNAMIKAYGRWGDVKTAYQLADEMREKQIRPTAETFNFLMQACASDSKFGFRHCLLTWHKMLQSGFKPDYYSFNTMLRCVRDCGFGDIETMQDVIRQILGERQAMQLAGDNDSSAVDKPKLLVSKNVTKMNEEAKSTDNPQNTIETFTSNPFRTAHNDGVETTVESGTKSKTHETNDRSKVPSTNPFTASDTDLQTQQHRKEHNSLEMSSELTSEVGFEAPNLLAPKPHLGSMLALSEITRPHERFLLLGGLTGFLDQMKGNGITPNIQMFTMMLEVIPPTNSAEKQVLTLIRRIGLKTDIDFFNVLIKKRSMRFDYEGAKEVLSMINTAGLHPDIVTYGVLALGCRTQEEARELLQEMRDKGVRMNIQILGAMLRQGCSQRSFPYVCEIMQISLDEHVKPNAVFLKHLHDFYTQCARTIDARHPSTKTKNYKKQHARFCDKMRLYHEEHGIAGLKLSDAIKVIKEGPYQQYKDAKVEGLEPEKNEALTRKQKIRKYIKKIKISNLKGDETVDENSKHTPELSQKSSLS